MPVMIIEQKTNVKIRKIFQKNVKGLNPSPPGGGGGVSESFVLKAFYSTFHMYLSPMVLYRYPIDPIVPGGLVGSGLRKR